MKLKDKINILFTGNRYFTDHKARLETLQRIYGSTNAVFANNGTSEVKEKGDAEIKKVTVADKDGKDIPFGSGRMQAGEPVTYTATVKAKEGKTLTAEELEAYKGKIKWVFWVGDKKVEATNEEEKQKTKKALRIQFLFSSSSKLKPESNKSFLNEKGKVTVENIEKCCLQYEISSSEEGKKFTDTLTITWSKWLDGIDAVRVEAYLDQPKKDSNATMAACSRIVKAKPEILDAYWMNAEGQKVNYAGYQQDLYLYLKTLGLKGKEVEVQVHEDDYYDMPSVPKQFPLSNNKKGDELIEWKNNKIKLEKHDVIKQFKVGDKKRYENAANDETDKEYKKVIDESVNEGTKVTMLDVTEKYGANLELYIHFPEQDNLKLDKNNQFANLTLTGKTQILDAYFGSVEEQKVQADAPSTKKNPTPTGKVKHYQKLDKGVLGQTIRLIAECPNLEGKKVSFHVFEKTPLLGEKDKALTLIYKDEEKTRIEANVKEGFAVAEVQLQPAKGDKGDENWEKLLDPDKGELKTAELYLKVEATENVFTVVNDGVFLEDEPFEMAGTTVIQDIYHDGTIGKVEYQKDRAKMKKVKFIYHDSSKKKHELGKFDITWVQKWKDATKHSWKGNKTGWKKVTVGGKTRYYQYDGKKETPLIMPFTGSGDDKKFLYSSGNVNIKLYEKTEREYHNPVAIATIFGALAEVGYDDIVCNGSVGSDGTGAYSLTHYNGINTDFKFLRKDKKKGKIDKDSNGKLIPIILSNDSKLDVDRQNKFIDALYKYGWGRTTKNLANKTSKNKTLNHCKNDSHHWNHLHIQGFKPNYKN